MQKLMQKAVQSKSPAIIQTAIHLIAVSLLFFQFNYFVPVEVPHALYWLVFEEAVDHNSSMFINWVESYGKASDSASCVYSRF